MEQAKKIKVLLLEDEASLAEIVSETLAAKGFYVYTAPTIKAAKKLFAEINADILVVDVMLPDGNGFDYVEQQRKSGVQIPVIFLTSRSRPEDVVKGFEAGANDYLKKPFSMIELIARMNALLGSRRGLGAADDTTHRSYTEKIGLYRFEYPSGVLSYNDARQVLSSREADLLHLLIKGRNILVRRTDLLLLLWHNDDYFSGRSLDVFISRLRKRFGLDTTVSLINIRGKGYRFVYP
ncbi:MAG: response regulator transcription factor [Ferruginibacter sp.]